MLYDRIALERHDFSATRAERLQNSKHWVLRLNADGPRNLFDSDKNLPRHEKQCLKMQDAHLAETGKNSDADTSTTINSVRDKISSSKEEKTSITMSIARPDGGITESHGETRRSIFNFAVANELELMANLQHLRNGGDFGFLERIPKNRRHVWTLHP